MYKLLLVSDREEVLSAFDQVRNWEMLGFKQPHIRHDFEGAKESLHKHHADGIAIAVAPEEEEKIIAYLQEYYPMVSIFEAGKDTAEVLRYLSELKVLLNRIHADFSSDGFNEQELMAECRHDFFRKVVSGKIGNKYDMYRSMRLLRSRMDADRPCVLMELEQPKPEEDKLEGRWYEGDQRLERALINSFSRDTEGFHIVPLVTDGGKIHLLAAPLHGEESSTDSSSMTAMLNECAQDGIEHMKEYQGLDLSIVSVRVLPSLNALCSEQE